MKALIPIHGYSFLSNHNGGVNYYVIPLPSKFNRNKDLTNRNKDFTDRNKSKFSKNLNPRKITDSKKWYR
jgi:hypothetical protein